MGTVRCGSVEGPIHGECLIERIVGYENITFASKVFVDVKLGKSNGFERVIVYANVFHGRINCAVKCVKLNREDVVMGNVGIGGHVENAESTPGCV